MSKIVSKLLDILNVAQVTPVPLVPDEARDTPGLLVRPPGAEEKP
jgi:hypothetical protein